jgi:SAM-dependent methyltransferase
LSARSLYQRTGQPILRSVGAPIRRDRRRRDGEDRDRPTVPEGLSGPPPPSPSERVNAEFWSSTDQIAAYESRELFPVEIVILARYYAAASGRVLELGCGAGRLLGFLATISREAHGIDISEVMVEKCNRLYPEASAQVGDIATLEGVPDLTFDAVFAISNVLDVFDDARRRQVLASLRDRIDPRGLLIISSHNLASREPGTLGVGRERISRRAGALLSMLCNRTPSELARLARRAPSRVRNRRRLAPLQYSTPTHAIINDHAHDYSMLLYYIDRDSQEQQLADVGYELLECLDVDGRPVPRNRVSRDPWLHYIARPRG